MLKKTIKGRYYNTCITEKDLKKVYKILKQARLVAWDIETNALNKYVMPDAKQKKTLCSSFTVKDRLGKYHSYCMYLEHPKEKMDINVKYKSHIGLKYFAKILLNPKIIKIVHNGKFEVGWCSQVCGIVPVNVNFDTILMAHLEYEDEAKGLEHLTSLFTSFKAHKSIIQDYDKSRMDDIPFSKLSLYNMYDTVATFKLYLFFKKKVFRDQKLYNYYDKIKSKLIYNFPRIENTGMLVDVNKLRQLKREKAMYLFKLGENYKYEIARATGDKSFLSMKLSQNEKLKEALYKLGFRFTILTDKAKEKQKLCKAKHTHFKPTLRDFQLNKDVLKELLITPKACKDVAKYEKNVLKFLLPLQDFRKEVKLYTTYIKGLLNFADVDNFVHADFNYVGTKTDRPSCSEPNLLNIPRDSYIKECFLAPYGKILSEVDASQGELKILAIFSEDPVMRKAFLSGIDLHIYTASMMFHVPIEKVTKPLRQIAKTINFGLVYGMTEFALYQILIGTKEIREQIEAGLLKLSPEICKEYMGRYFEIYKGVARFMREIKALARKQGYVETLLGQRRHLKDYYDRHMDSKADRFAGNAPIQGTLSQLIYFILDELYQFIDEHKLETSICNTVYDSILGYHSESDLVSYFNEVDKILKRLPIDTKGIPITMDFKIGLNWKTMFKCKVENNKVVISK